MYVSRDWELTVATINLAEKYGFAGLVITVDAQVLGLRRREKKIPFDSRSLSFPILDEIMDHSGKKDQHERRSWLANRDLGLTWETVSKIRKLTKLKIILKGVMNPRDAEKGVDYCDAIWVSNHGGRQLDTVSSTIDILPSIKAAVGGRVPIFVDGGVRTGNDIYKCLALGADFVFVGRPVLFSLIHGA